jgi:hypothetical protein
MRQALINENADLVQQTRATSCASPATTPKARPARQLHRPGVEVSGHRHHLAPAFHRRRCADLPPDRARPRSGLDDRVQADRRARHARARGHQEVLLHADRLPQSHQPLRRPGFRRRAGADLRAGRGRSVTPPRRRRRDDDDPTPPRRAPTRTVVDEAIPAIALPPGRRSARPNTYIDGGR